VVGIVGVGRGAAWGQPVVVVASLSMGRVIRD